MKQLKPKKKLRSKQAYILYNFREMKISRERE